MAGFAYWGRQSASAVLRTCCICPCLHASGSEGVRTIVVSQYQQQQCSSSANSVAGLEIRLRGRNQTENEHIKLGAFHTLELELHRPFNLHKDQWDSVDLGRIRQSTNPALSADLAIVLLTVCPVCKVP